MGERSENEGKRVRVGGGWRKGSDWEVNTRGRWLHHEGGHRHRRIDQDGPQPTALHSLSGAAVSTTRRINTDFFYFFIFFLQNSIIIIVVVFFFLFFCFVFAIRPSYFDTVIQSISN